ncbi:MAG: hypothetical protein FJ207_12310 [Gemmatimonadetes bacterium]|nr:hypothetical protein [Gemmatimonadota bacterium]
MLMRRARFATLLFLVACGGSGNGGTGPTPTPASITLSSTTVNFASLNQTQSLTATVRDAGGATISGATVTWSTSVASVATVSSGGLVTAVSNGTGGSLPPREPCRTRLMSPYSR